MSGPPTEVPAVITAYQAAHDQHDVDAALATFATDAVVHDEDHDWMGVQQIRQWLVKTSTEYTFTRTLLGAEHTAADSWVLRHRLQGNFPGGVVDLSYRFTLAGGHIARLEISP